MKWNAVIFGLVLATGVCQVNTTHAKQAGPFPAAGAADYDQYGGWKKLQGKRTGFFHIEKLNEQHWFVTPEGHAFFSKGVNSVNPDGMKKGDGDQGWAQRTVRQLRDWGLNTAGCWSTREVGAAGIAWTPRPHLSMAHGGKLPDVNDPAWARQVRERALKECAPYKDAPWVLGYFLDNEIRWDGDEGKASAYFKVMCEAIRAADPNHLILGCRFAGKPPMSVVREMKGRADVISINNYGLNPPISLLREMQAEAGLPFMVTEFSAKGKDSGPLTAHGSGPVFETQAERAHQLERYASLLANLEGCVGYHWFRYRDRPGNNQGLVKADEQPWPEMVEKLKKMNPTLEARHQR
jgi:hypothetical protein